MSNEYLFCSLICKGLECGGHFGVDFLLEFLIAMQADTFVVALHEGFWRIGYNGQWYGTYKDTITAVVSAMRIARDVRGTWVVVRKMDGSEKIVWNPQPGN